MESDERYFVCFGYLLTIDNIFFVTGSILDIMFIFSHFYRDDNDVLASTCENPVRCCWPSNVSCATRSYAYSPVSR